VLGVLGASTQTRTDDANLIWNGRIPFCTAANFEEGIGNANTRMQIITTSTALLSPYLFVRGTAPAPYCIPKKWLKDNSCSLAPHQKNHMCQSDERNDIRSTSPLHLEDDFQAHFQVPALAEISRALTTSLPGLQLLFRAVQSRICLTCEMMNEWSPRGQRAIRRRMKKELRCIKR
jgi:hypothetical protein